MKDIYFKIPLYKKNEITDQTKFIQFLEYDGTVDGYNPHLDENTTYRVKNLRPSSWYEHFESYCGYHPVELSCVRTGFTIRYYFLIELDETDEDNEKFYFQKVGQYPTIADLEISQLKKYSKIFSKNDKKELVKAIGLSSNGVGVGSFVYLRRIFENLITKHYDIAKQTTGWNDDEYHKCRMAEKIGMLKDFLPEFVVKNKSIYSIVSKGIHELEEQECLEYFPVLKDAIILILEMDYKKWEKQNQENQAQENIQKIIDKLSKDKT
ncbi:hypothetical protein DRF62_10480 [Chryseobacterium piscium]|uniref:Uncharacterized protein n=1 Tax=Chryseobacterium piscium TaxID=333702 RepID=A0A3D9BL95_9FLAO|nr:hypothetical protein [Chryseobacterium piscium]REC54226.1 hypothetical protein DRF62_10480 [Chryseobacterium piscium]